LAACSLQAGLCVALAKKILEQARLVNVIAVPEQVLTREHIVFISCYIVTGMLSRGAAERKISPGDCTVA